MLATYILMKSLTEKLQIWRLADNCTNQDSVCYGCYDEGLLNRAGTYAVDLSLETDDNLGLRTNVFSGEITKVLWQKNKLYNEFYKIN